MVGTKADLYDEEVISEEEGKEFAKKIGALFKLVSSQNNTGIDDLFESIAKEYLEIEQNPENDKEHQILSKSNKYYNY